MKFEGLLASLLCAFLLSGFLPFVAQSKDHGLPGNRDSVQLRPAAAGGMGVSYVGMTDVVDLANVAGASLGGYQRLPEFKAAAEFFGAVTVPVSRDWELKFEYAYLIATYNVSTAYGSGQAEYTAMAHLPSLIVQYLVVNEPVFNVKLGAGGGYHFGALDVKYFTQDDEYTGKGPGFVMDAEGNTAFGDHLFAYLGANLRWDLIGRLSNRSGLEPFTTGTGGSGTTMHFFGFGARLGFAYYF